jgi:hypothetical protein
MARLKNSVMVRTLAADLGLRATADPVAAIVQYCHAKVQRFLRELPSCKEPGQLLQLAANKLGTEFREVHTNDQLDQVRAEFVQRQEPGFIRIHEEFSRDVLGITIKRIKAHPWELPYVSVIDCRGGNARRSYFTKWHELGHLLILTDQTRLVFMRTHAERKTPEESLVDVIAGSLAFYPSIVRAHAKGELSFAAVEELRLRWWPDASAQAALIGITKSWPGPGILVDARMDYKEHERPSAQSSFGFREEPKPSLRAVHVTPNDACSELALKVIPRFRVPKASVIARVFREQLPYEEAVEDLSSWRSSDGQSWDGGEVLVKAKLVREGVQALLLPVHTLRRNTN